MALRNFWVETQADGSQTKQATGPRAKDGGFTTRVYVRNDGGITQVLRLEGRVLSDGKTLRLHVDQTDGGPCVELDYQR